MKVIGFNGSARRQWNTAALVESALAGAAAEGAETELVELYAEPVKGCMECFACKRKGNKTGGLCAIRDNMRPLLEKALAADVVIIGSPNFFGYPAGMVRALLERFLFPLESYEVEDGQPVRILGKRVIPAGVIFTMNVTEEDYAQAGYEVSLGMTRANLEFVLGYAEQYNAYDTLQFKDYSVMDANYFDATAKQERHEQQFPHDREACYEMGRRLVRKAAELNR